MKIFIGLLLAVNLCYSQNNNVPFSELDDQGKKHGYWKTFIDSNLTMVNDSSKATWYFYRLFYHGKPVIGLKFIPFNENELNEFTLTKPERFDSVTGIDGIYHITWNRKVPLAYKLIFKNGFLIERHDILTPDGGNWDICKFDWIYKNNSYSFFYRKFHVWNKHKLRETYYYYENGKMKSTKTEREVKSSNYYDNNEFIK